MADDFDALFSQAQGQQEEDQGEELRPPRKLKSPANILAAARWTARQMMAGTLRAEQGLSTVRALELLLRMSEEVEPEEIDLPTQRRLEAAQIDREENQQLRKRLARFEGVDARLEPEESSEIFKRGAEPVQVVDHRSANLQNEAHPQDANLQVEPTSTAEAVLADAGRQKTEEDSGW